MKPDFLRGKKIVAVLLLICLLLTTVLSSAVFAEGEEETDIPGVSSTTSNSYHAYLESIADETRPDTTVVINASDYDKENTDNKVEIYKDYDGDEGESLYTTEDGTVSWKFTVEKAGWYNIEMRYYPVKGKSSSINRSMTVDGKVMFDEMNNLVFSRIWKDCSENLEELVKEGQTLEDVIKEYDFPDQITFKKSNDNEIRPFQYEVPEWIDTYLIDNAGFYSEPFLFYFEAGEHTLAFTSEREPLLIKSFTLKQKAESPSYEEYLQQYSDKNDAPAGATIKIQAENMYRKSDPSIYPTNDRSSPNTEHIGEDGQTELNHASKQRMNSVDGSKWKRSGEWVEWQIKVEQSGFYNIVFKARQNTKNGSISYRRLLINGEVPFKEADNIGFTYNARWEMTPFQNGDVTYKLYFEAGQTYTLRMENTLGDMADIIRRVEESMTELTRAYRMIHVLTGTTPDTYRDYGFEQKTPEALEIMREQISVLDDIENDMINLAGMRGDDTVVVNRMKLLLQRMTENTNRIAGNFAIFRDNIGSMGTWISSAREQPLSVDYILIESPEDEIPEAEANWWSRMVFEFKAFYASFFEDYDSIGESSEDSVLVWVGNGITGGRDQANIIKQLADNYFTPNSGINVTIRLVNMAALLPATLAGIGPDVTLQLGQSDPVNYAFRGAIVDLAQFDDFDEVAERFHESSLIPFSFREAVYALPETLSYPMLFYRTDVLEEMGLEVPQTWDDVIYVIDQLGKQQLQFAMPAPTTGVIGAGNSTYATLLYQMGGTFYEEDGVASTLNNKTAIEAFKVWTRFYTDYGLPIDYDFANRFRTGEMPIAIADYGSFNVLSVSAPEIDGLWDFCPIPGTLKTDENGNEYIDRTTVATVTGAVIMTRAEERGHADECWEFLKWWTDADAQSRFGTEMESLLGSAARYQTANMDALEKMPWSTKAYNSLKEQRQWLTNIPEVPGGYYMPRQLEFAWRKVYTEKADPAEMLIEYVLGINQEIERKREEFKDKLEAMPKSYRYTEKRGGENQ